MKITIGVNPVVIVPNRLNGKYGIGEIVNLTAIVSTGGDIATIGGVGFRLKQGSGVFTNVDPVAGTATFTAPEIKGIVKIAAYGLNTPDKELAVSSLDILAPMSLKFVKAGGVIHTYGAADAGFRGNIFLQPSGVSYEQLQVQEGEFAGKGSGYYASQNNMVHPASAAPAGIVNGNQVNGMDTIYSGIQGLPWSLGRFEWHIPWQYQVLGNANWVTFAYANHVQDINAMGVVSIGKFNCGPFKAAQGDPTYP